MVDSATASITIDAEPAAVMAVIADFPAYPEWAGFIKGVTVLGTGADGRANEVRFHLDAGIMRDEYTLAYRWTGDDRVEWNLVEARQQKLQHGSYTLRRDGPGTAVTYELEIETTIPIPGLIKRKAQGAIMDTALKGLKRRVEG